MILMHRTALILNLYWLVLVVFFAAGCGTIRYHRQIDQPLQSQLTTGIGGTVFRLNKSSDLPNVLGGRDIYGGKIDRGFAEVKLAEILGDVLVLDVVDVNRQTSETTMDRYKPFQQRGLVSIDVQQSTNFPASEQVKPIRVRFDTRKQKDIVISGVKVSFIKIQTYGVVYTLEDMHPSDVTP